MILGVFNIFVDIDRRDIFSWILVINPLLSWKKSNKAGLYTKAWVNSCMVVSKVYENPYSSKFVKCFILKLTRPIIGRLLVGSCPQNPAYAIQFSKKKLKDFSYYFFFKY